jgi:hypothetical protein
MCGAREWAQPAKRTGGHAGRGHAEEAIDQRFGNGLPPAHFDLIFAMGTIDPSAAQSFVRQERSATRRAGE